MILVGCCSKLDVDTRIFSVFVFKLENVDSVLSIKPRQYSGKMLIVWLWRYSRPYLESGKYGCNLPTKKKKVRTL